MLQKEVSLLRNSLERIFVAETTGIVAKEDIFNN